MSSSAVVKYVPPHHHPSTSLYAVGHRQVQRARHAGRGGVDAVASVATSLDKSANFVRKTPADFVRSASGADTASTTRRSGSRSGSAITLAHATPGRYWPS